MSSSTTALRPVALGVVAVLLAVGGSLLVSEVVRGSGDQSNSTLSSSESPALGAGDQPTSQPLNDESIALQEKADSLFEQFNGTPSQRNDSSLLQAWALNGAMDTCMAAQGFPGWDWSAARNASPRASALGPSLFFAPPLARSYSNALRDSTESLIREQSLRARTVGSDEEAAVSKCAASTKETSDEAASQASTPALVSSLRNEWYAMLASAQQRYGDVEAYNACFGQGAQGLAISSTEGDSWRGELSTLAPQPSDIPPTGDSGAPESPAWQDFVDLEGALESVDWECRRSTYETYMNDMDRDLSSFAETHAADLSRVASAWQDITQRAGNLPK